MKESLKYLNDKAILSLKNRELGNSGIRGLAN